MLLLLSLLWGARQTLRAEQLPARTYTVADGLAHDQVQKILRDSHGFLWFCTIDGLTRGGGLSVFDGERFRNYTTAQGLSNRVETIAEDNAGNVWVGTQNSGVVKIARDGLISFRETDGLGNPEIISIFETRAGDLCAIGSRWTINRYDGERFDAIRPNLPQRIVDSSSGRWMMIEDHAGEWWVATNEGLYRFASVNNLEELAKRPPKARYTTRDGLADNNISRLFEDRRGDIWIGSFNPPVMLTRWERATDTFHRYTEADGLPGFNWANVFADDADGNLWFGLHNGGIGRRRGNRFEVFGEQDGVPKGLGQGLYRDRQDRLWFASGGGGACRVDDATAERPRFTTYTVRENISSNNLRSFAEDAWGNIYLGTARGVDRLDPQTNQVNHFSTADGLAKSEVTAAFRDRHDRLWFGTREGLSRFEPALERAHTPPPVFIGGLRIGNASYPIPELGAADVAKFELQPNQNQIQVDFFSLAFGVGETINYQYKLEGSAREWSAPADERSVTFANLAPGAYRFSCAA